MQLEMILQAVEYESGECKSRIKKFGVFKQLQYRVY